MNKKLYHLFPKEDFDNYIDRMCRLIKLGILKTEDDVAEQMAEETYNLCDKCFNLGIQVGKGEIK